MTRYKRWRGLTALLEDAVEHGSRAVERIHMETTRRPFWVIEKIPGVAAPTKVVHAVHDVAVGTTYEAVRLVNRAVGAVLDVTLGALEAKEAAAAEVAQPQDADT
jgi:hypothetical protein